LGKPLDARASFFIMAKTKLQLRTHARVYLDEISEADWTDDQIDVEVNYAYQEVAAAVIDVYQDYYRSKSENDLEDGVSEYRLPDDFLKVRRLEVQYASTDGRRKATRYDFDANINAWDDNQIGSTSRPVYDLNGPYVRILPVPTEDVANGLLMFYIKEGVTDLSDSDDEIDIPNPNRYGRLIVIGAAAELLRKGQQEELVASSYDIKFQAGLEKMKQELRDRIADGSWSITDTLGDWNDFGAIPGFTAIYT